MSDRLNPGESLVVGESITSANGRYTLILQGDGNLVLYISGSEAIWSTRTDGRDVSSAVMQGDGNFVLYGGGGAVWSTGTQRNPGSYIIVQDDGNCVIYSPSGPDLWSSGTAGGGFGGKLAGWAVHTGDSIPSTPHWADHTFATFENYVNKWDCSSGTGTNEPDDPNTRLIALGTGSRTKARCIGSVANSGIVWGVTGFCHQCTNRVLYPASIIVHRAAGYNISSGMHNTYGSDPASWSLIKANCGARFAPPNAPKNEDETVHSLPEILRSLEQQMDAEQHIAPISETIADDFYTESELDYFAKIKSLYDQPVTSARQAAQVLADDLALLIEFALSASINQSALRTMQDAQRTFQEDVARCHRGFRMNAILAVEAYSFTQLKIRTLFESYEKAVGAVSYESLFGVTPEVISKIPSPYLKHSTCGC